MGLFGLFKKKATVDANEIDRRLAEKFPAKVDVLIVTATDESIKEKLRDFRGKVEYLSISPKADVLKQDQKISNALDDLKILLSKKEDPEKVESALRELERMVAERAVIYN